MSVFRAFSGTQQNSKRHFIFLVMENQWCTIESDPGVFTELIETFGVGDIEVEEIYSLNPDDQKLGTSFGLIFLFKWKSEVDERPVLSPMEVPDLFFARQVIPNACATQAILSVILNSKDIVYGETLANFKAFASELDSESKGFAIGNSDVIRIAHNSFARPDPFVLEDPQKNAAKGDAYHFVAYIPFHGQVYELDGLKTGPILLGSIEDDGNWWNVARPAIENRMARYSSSETHFALMSIGRKLTAEVESQLADLKSDLENIQVLLDSDLTSSVIRLRSRGHVEVGGSVEALQEAKSSLETQMSDLEGQLIFEQEKVKKWREENERRKHNYIPFVIALLRQLAAKGKLQDLLAK